MFVSAISKDEYEFIISQDSNCTQEISSNKKDTFVYKSCVTQTTLLETNNFWFSHEAICDIVKEFSERKTTLFSSNDNIQYRITFDFEKTVNGTRIGQFTLEADTINNKRMRPQVEFVTLYCDIKMDPIPPSVDQLVPILNQKIQDMSLVIEKLQQNIDFLNKQMVEQNEKMEAKRMSDIYLDSEIFCVDDIHYYLIHKKEYDNYITEIPFQLCREYPYVGKKSHQRHFSEHMLLYYTQQLKFTPVKPFLDVTKNGLLNFYVDYKNINQYHYYNMYNPNISTIHQAFVKYIVTHPDWIKYVENIEHTTDSLKISFPFKKKYSFFMHADSSYIQQTKWCVNVGGYAISEGLWNVINQKLFRLETKIYAEVIYKYSEDKNGQMCFPSILIEKYRLIESLKDEMIVGEKQFLLDTFKFLCAFFDVCNEFYCRGKILLPPRNGYAQFKHHPTDPDYLNKFNMFKYISGSTVKPQDKVHFCKLLGFYQSSESEI
jgi:hypothetical protein